MKVIFLKWQKFTPIPTSIQRQISGYTLIAKIHMHVYHYVHIMFLKLEHMYLYSN